MKYKVMVRKYGYATIEADSEKRSLKKDRQHVGWGI